jgi:hypothetical protein
MLTFNRLFVATLLAGGLCAAPALAQQQRAAPAATAAAQISTEHLEAAKEVVRLSGIGRTFEIFLPQLADQTVATLTRTRPEIRNDLIAVLRAIAPEFEKRSEQMIETTARHFAGVMGEQALKETAAFFRSDAGKQYVAMQPRVIDQMVISLDAWNRLMSEDLMSRVRVEMRKKGHTL